MNTTIVLVETYVQQCTINKVKQKEKDNKQNQMEEGEKEKTHETWTFGKLEVVIERWIENKLKNKERRCNKIGRKKKVK